jgi:hypothetical protein
MKLTYKIHTNDQLYTESTYTDVQGCQQGAAAHSLQSVTALPMGFVFVYYLSPRKSVTKVRVKRTINTPLKSTLKHACEK